MALAHVRIAGQVFAAVWDGSSAVALADFTIVWGTKTRYDDVPPASLKLRLIDPSGWVFRQQFQGLPIDIAEREDFDGPSIVFRGRIQTANPEQITVAHPETGEPVRVWQVEISAKDPLADLATAIVAGPGPAGSWPVQTIRARATHILSLIKSEQLETIDTPGTGSVKGYAADSLPNLLDLLRRGWWAGATWARRIHYEPYTWQRMSGIVEAIVRHRAGLVLEWNGASLKLTTTGGNDNIVAASTIKLPRGGRFESALDSALDVVQVTTENSAGDALIAERHTARYAGGMLGLRVLKIESDQVDSFPATGTADLIAAVVESVNGKWQHPTIRVEYDPTAPYNPAAGPVWLLMRPWMQPYGWYFIGSQWNDLPGAGMHQVIGGTITCTGKKWVTDVTLAPVVDTIDSPPTVTIADLITNPAPTFSDFDPAITLADFGHVTQGAS